jgi:hypothetical protein
LSFEKGRLFESREGRRAAIARDGRSSIRVGRRQRRVRSLRGWRQREFRRRLQNALVLFRQAEMRPRGSLGGDDPLGKKVRHGLPRGRDVGGEEAIERPVLADDDDDMFDRRCGPAGKDRRGNSRGRQQDGGEARHAAIAVRTAPEQWKHGLTPCLIFDTERP